MVHTCEGGRERGSEGGRHLYEPHEQPHASPDLLLIVDTY